MTINDETTARCMIAAMHEGKVLVTGNGTLPQIVDNRWPEPAELLAAVPGVRAIQIAPTVMISAQPRVTLHVLGAFHLVPGRWVDPHSVALAELEHVLQSLENLPARRPDWFRIGWLDEALIWIDAQLAELGRRRNGPPVVLKMWSLSVVLEISVDADSKVYFKATCAWFGAEPVLTAKLGEMFPGVVTPVLAINTPRSWMLMDPLPAIVGADEADNTERLVEIAELAADLQMRSATWVTELVAAGCMDRTLRATERALQIVLNEGLELTSLSRAERDRLIELTPLMVAELAELAECGVPWTLVHGDLHAGNVAHGPAGQVIFDWTDACISHPFLDLVMLAELATDPAAVRRAYLKRWRDAYPAANVNRAWELTQRVNWMFQAITYEGIQRNQEDASAWELAGVQADCLRKLLRTVVKAGSEE